MLTLMRKSELTNEQWQHLRPPATAAPQGPGTPEGRWLPGAQRHSLRAAHGMSLGRCTPRVRLPSYLLAEAEGIGAGWHLGENLAQLTDFLVALILLSLRCF